MLLARTVTHSTIDECKQRMSWPEFKQWAAEYSIEPWGNEWDQARAIAASNLAPWSKRSIKLDRFFPKGRQKPAVEQYPEMSRWAKRHNRRVRRERNGGHRQPRNHAQRQQRRADRRTRKRP